MIKLQIIGHLGKDCTVNDVNGKQVINFSVAHTDKFKDAQGNQKERTTWVECAYWNDSQLLPKYLLKGSQVFAEGQPEVRTWEGNNGHGASMTIRVTNIQLLGGKPQVAGQHTGSPAPQQASNAAPKKQQGAPAPEIVDDLPF